MKPGLWYLQVYPKPEVHTATSAVGMVSSELQFFEIFSADGV